MRFLTLAMRLGSRKITKAAAKALRPSANVILWALTKFQQKWAYQQNGMVIQRLRWSMQKSPEFNQFRELNALVVSVPEWKSLPVKVRAGVAARRPISATGCS